MANNTKSQQTTKKRGISPGMRHAIRACRRAIHVQSSLLAWDLQAMIFVFYPIATCGVCPQLVDRYNRNATVTPRFPSHLLTCQLIAV